MNLWFFGSTILSKMYFKHIPVVFKRTFHNDGNVLFLFCSRCGISSLNVTSVTEKLYFYFNLIYLIEI